MLPAVNFNDDIVIGQEKINDIGRNDVLMMDGDVWECGFELIMEYALRLWRVGAQGAGVVIEVGLFVFEEHLRSAYLIVPV